MNKRKHAIYFTEPTMTQQHSKDEVDINKIMARYIKTGVIDHVQKYQPQYTENNEVDYHESMNVIRKADEMFLELPSSVRKTFHNDPAKFLEFVNDENNIDKLSEMGLTSKTKSPTGDKTTAPPAKTAEPKTPPSEPAPASDA